LSFSSLNFLAYLLSMTWLGQLFASSSSWRLQVNPGQFMLKSVIHFGNGLIISEYFCLPLLSFNQFSILICHSSTNITLFQKLTAPLHKTLIFRTGHPRIKFLLLCALSNPLPTTHLFQWSPIHFSI
jgi:hypothetical protein